MLAELIALITQQPTAKSDDFDPSKFCRGSGRPEVSLLYPTDVAVLPSVGFVAISVSGLLGTAVTAEIRLTPKLGKAISVTAVLDSTGREFVQTLHAVVPHLEYGTYDVHVVLHDGKIRCGIADDQYDVRKIVINRAVMGLGDPPIVPTTSP